MCGGGHLVSENNTDPVRVSVGFCEMLSCFLISNEIVGRSETNLHGYNIGGMMKAWLGFGDLDFIFKVSKELNRSNLRVCGCVLGDI